MDPARELRELRRIEHRLTAEGPGLAATLSALGATPRRSARGWALLAAGLIGVLVVVVGALTSDLPFLVAGGLVLSATAASHVLGRRRARHNRPGGWRA
ncbi:DUF3040 domain-containing protein [Lentzea sp. NPDC060358]|uniref:DUF3040 domain-containing protein n=1 Tax=Lentzea sp. NPDC060358 TaxID=3347103 RepID=UPI00365FCEB6